MSSDRRRSRWCGQRPREFAPILYPKAAASVQRIVIVNKSQARCCFRAPPLVELSAIQSEAPALTDLDMVLVRSWGPKLRRGVFMLRRTVIVLILAASLGPNLPIAVAQGEEERSGPLRLLVGFGSGSNADLTAHVMAEALTPRLGRTVVVENRPGRSGVDMAEALVRSAPDGATLGMAQAALAVARHTTPGITFNLPTDVTPISLFAAAPMAILVAPDDPVLDLPALAEVVRTRPETPCATDPGAIFRLTLVRLLGAMGVSCQAVSVGNSGAAKDLQAGKIQFYVYLVPATLPAVRQGQMRFLAVLSRQHSSAIPKIPTAIESGLPSFDVSGWFALIGPRGLPEMVAARLEKAAVEAARDPVVAERLRALGAEPVGSSAAELATTLQAEDLKWGQAARAAGFATN